jgi:hypothetical protein
MRGADELVMQKDMKLVMCLFLCGGSSNIAHIMSLYSAVEMFQDKTLIKRPHNHKLLPRLSVPLTLRVLQACSMARRSTRLVWQLWE